MDSPAEEIFDANGYLGSGKKIFNVHFRNIRGLRNDVDEVAPYESYIDIVEAISACKQIAHHFMLMMACMPIAAGNVDPGSAQSIASRCGCSRELIQFFDSTT